MVHVQGISACASADNRRPADCIGMAGRTKLVSEARLRAERDVRELVAEVRNARLAAGLRQADIARAIGWSVSRVGRLERGAVSGPGVVDLAIIGAAVGLALRPRLVPAPSRLRDAGQLRYINAYTNLVAPGGWQPQIEAAVGGPGDPRAFDLMMTRPGVRVAHEFITQLRDVQGQVRPILRKASDGNVTALVLVVADTRANRRAINEAGPALRTVFPLGTRATLDSMRAGQAPPAAGLVVLRLPIWSPRERSGEGAHT